MKNCDLIITTGNERIDKELTNIVHGSKLHFVKIVGYFNEYAEGKEINDENIDEIITKFKSYYFNKIKDASLTISKNQIKENEKMIGGYSDITAKTDAEIYVARLFNRIYCETQMRTGKTQSLNNYKREIKKRLIDYYSEISNSFSAEAKRNDYAKDIVVEYNKVSEDIKKEKSLVKLQELKDKQRNLKLAYIASVYRSTDNTEYQNIAALIDELISNEDNLYERVLNNHKELAKIAKTLIGKDEIEDEDYVIDDEGDLFNADGISDTNEVDTTLNETIKKGSLSANFISAIDNVIYSYLSTIEKTEVDSLGMFKTYTAQEIINFLISRCDFSSESAFYDSILDISNKSSIYKNISKIYGDCFDNNDKIKNYDLAFRLFKNLHRISIYRTQAVANGYNDKLDTRLINEDSTVEGTLFQIFNNNFKSSVVSVDYNALNNLYKLIDKEYIKTSVDATSPTIREYITYLTTIIKEFVGDVNYNILYNYITKNKINGRVNQKFNFDNLYNIAGEFIKNSNKIQNTYNRRQNDIDDALVSRKNALAAYNDAVESKKDADTINSLRQEVNELESYLNKLYRQNYISEKEITPIYNLIDAIKNYSDVTVTLNHPNGKGNNRADTIDDCYLTYIRSNFANENLANAFIKELTETSQFRYNSLLFSQAGVKTNSLFVFDGVSYKINPQYVGFLDIKLFDSTVNRTNNQSTLYSAMSENDYIPTAFIHYFSPSKSNSRVKDDRADYFLRTPADAPKNFVVTSFRSKIKGLFDSKGNIDVNHSIFRQLVNIFKGELLEAAIAMDAIFEIDKDGFIRRDGQGNPILKSNISIDNLSDNYHKQDNKVFERTSDGGVKLVGKVFNSDRFIVFKDGKEINYGQQLLDNLVSFFYGGDAQALSYVKRNDADIDIRLTNEQEDKINEMIKDFINDKIDTTIERIQESSGYIAEFLYNNENIEKVERIDVADFILNYFITQNNFDALFDGSSKFYSNAQNQLKRDKEIQAGGKIYGVFDLNNPNGEVKSILNDRDVEVTYHDKDGNLTTERVLLGHTFTGVTIENTNHIIPEIDIIQKELEKNKSISKEAIESITKGFKVKGNDGLSYITWKEFIKRITAKGEFQRYEHLINAINDTSKEIDPNILSEFAMIQKNVYYDQYLDSKTHIRRPRFIKNAEFILIPRFIEGTELEQLYDIMMQNGIDQVNTLEASKASQPNVLTFWNEDGSLPEENIKSFSIASKNVIETFNYNFLYNQVVNKQHMDSDNKAGIQAMKKIADNISEQNAELYKYKEAYVKSYVENITSSYRDLMNELGIEIDANDNLVLDEFGQITSIKDLDVFFKRLRAQAQRTGIDSNLMKFLTPEVDENGNTSINTYPSFLPCFEKPLENVAQALFNSTITRQTLPGFHAAQTSNVGWKLMKSSELTDGDYRRELKYHAVEKIGEGITYSPYVEIMIPKNSKQFYPVYDKNSGKVREMTLNQMIENHLDEVIIYRIPTENKCSIAIGKIVALLPESYGSTIVLPDGWAAQTGADNDNDTVYGITKHVYFDGESVKSIEFVKDRDWKTIEGEETLKRMYVEYIKAAARKLALKFSIKSLTKEEFKDKVKESKDILSEDYTDTLTDNYDAISQDFAEANNIIQFIDKDTKKRISPYLVKNDKMGLFERVTHILEELYLSNQNDDAILNLISIYKDIADKLTDNSDIKKDLNETAITHVKANILIDKARQCETFAKENGLPSIKEFESFSIERKNSREARDNEILDNFINILKHSDSLQENLTGSNFKHITDSLNKYSSETYKNARKARTAYDFIDQADNAEDATSAIALKGMSVMYDTFASVCNNAKAIVAPRAQIRVKYRKTDTVTDKTLKLRYDDNKVNAKNDYLYVTHSKYGWTNDYKQVEGEILTGYTSETTAHTLDVMKSGNVPNVNTYTFMVYKHFLNVGSNYDTAISFMLQPAVTEIVNIYNKSKSVFNNDKINNPILTAIREWMIRNGIINDNENFETIINNFNNRRNLVEALNQMFDAPVNETVELTPDYISKLVFSADENKRRIDGEMTADEANIYDLGILLQFYNLMNVTNEINNYVRVSNPDKFGAKQTTFATEEIFDSIDKIVKGDSILIANNKNLIDALYPGLIVNGSVDINHYLTTTSEEKSVYPFLNAFLKFASAASIKVTEKLFPQTHNRLFKDAILKIKEYFNQNEYLGKINENIFNDFKSYIISYLYTKTPIVANPMSVSVIDETSTDEDYVPEIIYKLSSEENDIYSEKELEDEISRIYGYNRTPIISFTVDNIAAPTQDEINEFAKLSPAQQVKWIKDNFNNGLIFDLLNVNLFNVTKINSKGRSPHIITFNYSGFDIEDALQSFKSAFYNTNPFIRLAAINLIKYAAVVEGFGIKYNGISKIIAVEALDSNEDGRGTNFVNDALQYIKSGLVSPVINDNITESVLSDEDNYINFIRSHSNLSQIARGTNFPIKINGNFKTMFLPTNNSMYNVKGIRKYKGDVYSIVPNAENRVGLERLNIIGKSTITEENGKEIVEYDYNKIVTIRNKKQNTNTLYRIVVKRKGDIDILYLYPLNILEENENSRMSVNSKNNKFASSQLYEEYIENIHFEVAKSDTIFQEAFDKERVNNVDSKSDIIQLTFDKLKNGNSEHSVNKLIGDIIANNNGFIQSLLLNSINPVADFEFINESNGTSYRLTRMSSTALWNKYVAGKGKISSPSLKAIIENAKSGNPIKTNYVYRVTAIQDKSSKKSKFQSSMTSSSLAADPLAVHITSILNTLKEQVKNDDEIAIEAIENLKLEDVNVYTKDSNFKSINVEQVQDKIDVSVHIVRKAIESYYKKFQEDINEFQIGKDEYLPINSTKIIDRLFTNPELREKFLKTILDAETFAKRYENIFNINIEDFSGDISKSEQEQIRNDITAIRTIINDIAQNDKIKSAINNFIVLYLTKLTNDPLIKAGYLDLLNSYHNLNWLNAQFDAVQHSPINIMQVAMKEIQSTITGEMIKAKEERRKFDDRINAIIEKAKEDGVEVDYDKFIDEQGNFYKDYSEQFANDYNALVASCKSATYNLNKAIKEEYLSNEEREQAIYSATEEKIIADRELAKFKLQYLHQRLNRNYYISKLNIEDMMLTGGQNLIEYNDLTDDEQLLVHHKIPNALKIDDFDNSIKETYIKYKAFKYQADAIKKVYFDEGEWTDSAQEETYDNLMTAIHNLLNDTTSVEIYDELDGELTTTLTESNTAQALNRYKHYIKELYDLYFDKQAKFNFERNLRQAYKIIVETKLAYKDRDIFKTEEQLSENVEYKEAVKWLVQNTNFTYPEEIQKEIDEANEILYKRSFIRDDRNTFREVLRRKGIFDIYGNIIGTKISDTDIDEIKEDLERKYNIKQNGNGSDKILIGSNSSDRFYTKHWWKHFQRDDRQSNVDYYKLVSKINEIYLSNPKYYDNVTKTINLSEISKDDLKNLIFYYEQLGKMKKYTSDDVEETERDKEIAKFIKENAKTVTNTRQILNDSAQIREKRKNGIIDKETSDLLEKLMYKKVTYTNESGEHTKIVYNPYIYSHLEAKDSYIAEHPEIIDKDLQKARETIAKYRKYEPSEYYYQKRNEMLNEGEIAFNVWYNKNHIYNPHTHKVEPLPIWMKKVMYGFSDDVETAVKYFQPAFNQLQSKANEDYVDEEYLGEDIPRLENYIQSNKYDNPKLRTLNKYERQIKDEFKRELDAICEDKLTRNKVKQGKLPFRRGSNTSTGDYVLNTLLSFWGISLNKNSDIQFEDFEDYSNNRTPIMPMFEAIRDKSIKPYIPIPDKLDGESDKDYNEKVEKIKKDNAEIKKANDEVRAKLLDRDYQKVIGDFIELASAYNVSQKSKYLMYFVRNRLEELNVLKSNFSDNSLNKFFSRDRDSSYRNEFGQEIVNYKTEKNDNAVKLWENTIRRIVYDTYKKKEGIATNIGRAMQNYSSAKFMMMNITGGIANVTYGNTQMLMELFAGRYWSLKDATLGRKDYYNALIPRLTHSFTGGDIKFENLNEALIAMFNVIDFDTIIERGGDVKSQISQKIRNLMYSPQSSGEDRMQNGALCNMMRSNRIVDYIDDKGNKVYEIQDLSNYISNLDEKIFDELVREYGMLNRYRNLVANISKNPNRFKKYVYYRRNTRTTFIKLFFTDEQKREYRRRIRQARKHAADEFESRYMSIHDAFTLKKGYAEPKDSSALAELKATNIAEYYKLLGRFKQKVITVNYKIHGVYDKIGAAQIEKEWYGGLVMQYHKHIPTGIKKRWQTQGYYNEERDDIELGARISLMDFLAMPFTKFEKDVAPEDLDYVIHVKGLGEKLLSMTQLGLNYAILPRYQQQNILRNLGDLAGIVEALAMAVIARGVYSGDDDNLMYNTLIYASDRLASETSQYGVLAFREIQKMYSNPIAALQTIKDMYTVLGLVVELTIDGITGQKFEPKYKSGPNRGKNKFEVLLTRQVPIYRGINRFITLKDNNKYYKLGKNLINYLPSDQVWSVSLR